MRNTNLIVLEAFGSQMEAELAQGALEAAGIETMVSADTAGGMRPHIAWSGSGFKLLVREDEIATARTVLEQIKGPLKPIMPQ